MEKYVSKFKEDSDEYQKSFKIWDQGSSDGIIINYTIGNGENVYYFGLTSKELSMLEKKIFKLSRKDVKKLNNVFAANELETPTETGIKLKIDKKDPKRTYINQNSEFEFSSDLESNEKAVDILRKLGYREEK